MLCERGVAFGVLVYLSALVGENRGSRIKGKEKQNGKSENGDELRGGGREKGEKVWFGDCVNP